MGSSPDVYALLKEELKDSGAEVLTPDSPGYEESIVRWSEHCIKRAVSSTPHVLLFISIGLHDWAFSSILFCSVSQIILGRDGNIIDGFSLLGKGCSSKNNSTNAAPP